MYIFVYGTLMAKLEGACNPILERYGATLVGDATVNGRIYAVASYPGLRLDKEGVVHGELWFADEETCNIPQLVAALNNYEGYSPARKEYSLYLLEEATVMHNGEEFNAFTYVYNKRFNEDTLIEDGDYHRHRAARIQGYNVYA